MPVNHKSLGQGFNDDDDYGKKLNLHNTIMIAANDRLC